VITVKMANEQLPAYMGICPPASCSATEIEQRLYNFLTNPAYNISAMFDIGDELESFKAYCGPGHETTVTAGAVITSGLIMIILLLVIAGTYVETIEARVQAKASSKTSKAFQDSDVKPLLVESREDIEAHSKPDDALTIPTKTSSPHSRFEKLQAFVKCFGLRANSKFLFADNRGSEPHLACLNGLRTLMMAWVVLGHTFTYMAAPVGYDNLMTIKDLVSRVSFQVVPAAELSVDVFFYLSGFLVAYMVLKEMKAKHGRMPWGLFYFHRYWRLTPVYGFVILVYTTLTPYMIRGPFHFLYRSTKTDLCVKYWWTNLLYINNFYPTVAEDECIGWSWYLANDMQFYIISPIILIVYYKSRRAGWALVTLLITACMVINAVLSYTYELVPLDPGNAPFMTIIYDKPYTRIATYLVGVLVAFLVQEDVDLSAKRWIRWTGYILGLITTTCATYLTVGFWRHGWNLLQDVMFMTFARVGFTLAVGWAMYSFHKGHGGVIREVLSLHIWVPLARLTYTVYLVHPIVIFVINYSTTTTFHYSAIYGGVRYSSHLVIAYLVGLLFHLCIEKPTANLERMFLPKKRAHR
jgi:peptidoglycan/LPS O-acetylase OafA/YrhL